MLFPRKARLQMNIERYKVTVPGPCQTIGEAQAAKISTSGTAVLCRPFVPQFAVPLLHLMLPMHAHFWGQKTKIEK